MEQQKLQKVNFLQDQYSKLLKQYQQKMATAEVQEVINKLQKLKQQATSAPDFTSLDKVAGKVNKIRTKLLYTRSKSNKQLNAIIDKIDLLIREKNKYFRQKLIKNSNVLTNQDSPPNEETDQTLKYSKSAENFKLISNKHAEDTLSINHFVSPSAKRNIKNNYSTENYYDNEKTINQDRSKVVDSSSIKYIKQNIDEQQLVQSTSAIIPTKKTIKRTGFGNSVKIGSKKMFDEQEEQTLIGGNGDRKQYEQNHRLRIQLRQLQQKLTQSGSQMQQLKEKITKLQNAKQQTNKMQKLSPMSKAYIKKHEQVVDEYIKKLREKTVSIEQLKSKIEYYQSITDELKSKIMKEQKIHEEELSELKKQNKKLKRMLQQDKTVKQGLLNQVQQTQYKNEQLLKQVKKLVQKLEYELKQKEQIKRTMSSEYNRKIQQLQKELSRLNKELFNISKLEIKVQAQKQENNELKKFISKLQSQVKELEQESKKYLQQRNQSQMQAFQLTEQIKYLKSELKINIEAKQILAQELLQVKDRLEEHMKNSQIGEYQKQLKEKSKLNKLKQIKGLLSQLK